MKTKGFPWHTQIETNYNIKVDPNLSFITQHNNLKQGHKVWTRTIYVWLSHKHVQFHWCFILDNVSNRGDSCTCCPPLLIIVVHLFHCNLKPIGLVTKVEAANENLPSKKSQYKHVLAKLQKHASISQIVEIPKPTRTHKSSKMNLLSHVLWPMTPAMAITTREAMHHTSLQVSNKKRVPNLLQLHPKYNVQAILLFLMEILQLVLLNPNWPWPCNY